MTQSVMQQLKDATWDLHENAENHKFQKTMAAGTLGKEGYVAFLAQMYFVHRAVEARLHELADAPRYQALIHGYHFRLNRLAEDLRFFGADPANMKPNSATEAFVSKIEARMQGDDLAVLGMHYVLEGSTNGSKYIAKSVRQGLALQSDEGLAYLDPHGDEQRPRWKSFKEDMDAMGFNETECASAVKAARDMFQGMIEISESLMPENAAVGSSNEMGNETPRCPFGH